MAGKIESVKTEWAHSKSFANFIYANFIANFVVIFIVSFIVRFITWEWASFWGFKIRETQILEIQTFGSSGSSSFNGNGTFWKFGNENFLLYLRFTHCLKGCASRHCKLVASPSRIVCDPLRGIAGCSQFIIWQLEFLGCSRNLLNR